MDSDKQPFTGWLCHGEVVEWRTTEHTAPQWALHQPRAPADATLTIPPTAAAAPAPRNKQHCSHETSVPGLSQQDFYKNKAGMQYISFQCISDEYISLFLRYTSPFCAISWIVYSDKMPIEIEGKLFLNKNATLTSKIHLLWERTSSGPPPTYKYNWATWTAGRSCIIRAVSWWRALPFWSTGVLQACFPSP